MRNESSLNRSTACYLIVYAVLVGLAISVNLPGRASSDAISSLYQARQLEALNSWHAPFVTFCYGLLAPLAGSPTGALIIQSLLLMLWPAAIATRIIQARRREALKAVTFVAWSIVCMMLIGIVGSIVKDLLLVGFMSAALAAFIGHRGVRHAKACSALRALWIAFCILACCLVRPPNIVILACAALVGSMAGVNRSSLGRRLGLAGGMVAGVWIATVMVNLWVLPAPSKRVENATFLFDLAGTSFYSDENLFASLDRNAAPALSIKDCYQPIRVNDFIWGKCKDYTQIYWERLSFKIWRRAMMSHPLAFIKHRAAFMGHLLDNEKSNIEWIAPSAPYVLAANTEIRIEAEAPEARAGVQLWKPTIAYLPFARIANNTFSGPLGRPLLWIAILALASISLFRLPPGEERALIAGLIATGLANVLMIGIFSPGDDLRYLLPTAFCALVVTVKFVEMGARRWAPPQDQIA